MDKEKISKELLDSVGSCKKQLKNIKSQLTTYLSDNEKRKESADSKTSGSPQERLRRKRTTHYIESSSNSDSNSPKKSKISSGDNIRGRGRPRKHYKDDTDSSFDEKDENYVVPSSRPSKASAKKSRGRRRKMSSSNSQSSDEKSNDDDKAYKPTSYVPKATKKSSNGNKKGRGRPPKKVKVDDIESKSDALNKEDSSSKVIATGNESEHVSLDDNISKRSQDGSFEAGEGHALESNVTDSVNKNEETTQLQSINTDNHSNDEAKAENIKKRGRPSTKSKDKTTKVSNKGRGRPKKSVTSNGATHESVDSTAITEVLPIDKTLEEITAIDNEETPKLLEECTEIAEATDMPAVDQANVAPEEIINDEKEAA